MPAINRFESATLRVRILTLEIIRMPNSCRLKVNGHYLNMRLVRSERHDENSWDIDLSFRKVVLEVFDERPAVPAGPNHGMLLG